MVDEIEELRAELRWCPFTYWERLTVEAELARLISERVAVDLAADTALDAMLAERDGSV